MRRKLLIGAGIAFGAMNVTASACPLCDSLEAREVREGIFNEQFGTNLGKALLPFAAVFGVMGIVHRLVPNPGTRSR